MKLGECVVESRRLEERSSGEKINDINDHDVRKRSSWRLENKKCTPQITRSSRGRIPVPPTHTSLGRSRSSEQASGILFLVLLTLQKFLSYDTFYHPKLELRTPFNWTLIATPVPESSPVNRYNP